MENINNINKMSKEAKTSYLKDPKIRKEYLLPQNHYEFIWLVQELKNEDILSFLDENMTNMLENDTKLEGKLNAIINCGNPQVNDYLKNDKVIGMINTFPDLEIYLSSLNLNFGQSYFNYITKNNHLEKFANLGSNIQLEIVKNINNLKLLKTIPIANTFLSDISIECASYLIKDPYFENIFLNQDIFEIDRMVKKGLVIPNHLITNKLISKYIGIQDVNIFYNIMTNLETNNPYLKQVVKKQMTKKYHTIINNVDPNLGIFSEYKDLIEKNIKDKCQYNLYLKLIDVDNPNERLTIIQDFTIKTMLEMTISLCYEDLAYNFLKNIHIILNYVTNTKENIIPKDRLHIYNKLYNYYNLTMEERIELFNYLINKEEIICKFYEDFRTCLNHAYQDIKNSCYKIDENKLNYIDNIPIYNLEGEKFKMVINHTNISRDKQDSNIFWHEEKNYVSMSLIGDSYLKTFRDPNDYVILGFNDFNIDNIMHLYKSDSYSQKEFGSNRVPTVENSDNLLKITEGYNEILMKESRKLKPSYVVCYDTIKQGDILTSRHFGNIPLIVINTKKYNTNITQITPEKDTYITPVEAYIIDSYKRK